jgi:hydroxypyruvate isomerase
MNNEIPRRSALKTLASSAALAATSGIATQAAHHQKGGSLKGNIHHSVCKWCYRNQTLKEVCQKAKDIGMEAIDLLGVDDYPTLKKFGLTCAVTSGVPGGIKTGLNRLENHDAIVEFFEHTLPIAKDNGSPNVICFSGNRGGMDAEQGLENCAMGLKRIAPIAERHGVTVIMELLNSKRNHADYMCDNSPWGVELCDRVGSERFKLLYDIYHMQIMEGDVIDTIKEFHTYFAHYHTGGVPGRNEIDDTQELYYPAIMRAIVETGYQGYVAQEFIPASDDPLNSLELAVKICDV